MPVTAGFTPGETLMDVLPRILGQVCLRDSCKERCPLPERVSHNLKLQTAIRALILVLAGMLMGGSLAIHLHGQSKPHHLDLSDQAQDSLITMSVKVNMMDATVMSLSTKLDRLQSEADTTQAIGTGIGISITLLQLLGFFTKSRQGG